MSHTVFRVVWSPTDDTQEIAKQGPGLKINRMTTNVRIIDGYTTEADIPKIIAVSRTGRPSDAQFVNIISSEIVSRGE